MLQLTDGRFVVGKPMTRTPEGVKIHFDNGDVLVKKSLVREATTSKTEGAAAPDLSPEDQEKVAQGFVRFEGKWMKKDQFDRLMEGRRKERERKIKEAMDRREWRSRAKLATTNFEFEYTIDPEVMKDFASLMEEYYKVFTSQWKITKPPGMGKLKVCFYHDQDLYYQVSGAGRGAIGYFRFVKPIELNFYFDRNDHDLTMLVMFHETNHYLTHLIDPEFNYPIWINESLAEYYGASKWDPVKKKMEVGFLQDGRLTVIKDHILNDKWQSLDGLMRLQQREFTADHYAWGWSLVHYLLENPKYAQKFKKFYVSLARDKSIKTKRLEGYGTAGPNRTVEPDEVIKAFTSALGVKDLKGIEKDWHEYVKNLEPKTARGFAEAAEMYEMYGMPIKATRFYETAIEKGDKRPVVYGGLGKVLARRGEWDKAATAYEAAIEGDPLNGMYYANLAQARSAKSRDGGDEEAKRLRKLALEVDPDNPDLLRFDAFAKLFEEEAGKKKPDGPKPEPAK